MAGEAQRIMDEILSMPDLAERYTTLVELEELIAPAQLLTMRDALDEFGGAHTYGARTKAADLLKINPMVITNRLRQDPALRRKKPRS